MIGENRKKINKPKATKTVFIFHYLSKSATDKSLHNPSKIAQYIKKLQSIGWQFVVHGPPRSGGSMLLSWFRHPGFWHSGMKLLMALPKVAMGLYQIHLAQGVKKIRRKKNRRLTTYFDSIGPVTYPNNPAEALWGERSEHS